MKKEEITLEYLSSLSVDDFLARFDKKEVLSKFKLEEIKPNLFTKIKSNKQCSREYGLW